MTAQQPSADASRAMRSELELICASVECVAYAFAVDRDGALDFEWAAGEISGTQPVPILALLQGRAGENEERVKEHVDALLSGTSSHLEADWTCPNYTRIHLLDRAQVDCDAHGRPRRIVGTVQDISDNLWMRQRLLAANWQHKVADYLDQGLVCWNKRDELVLINQHFRSLHTVFKTDIQPGMTKETFVSTLAHSGAFLIDGPVEAWIADTLRDLEEARAREHRLADGRWLQVVPFQISDGTIVRIHNITAQKSAERTLREAKELADSANLKKSRFLRAANHDLRQPLATLRILIYGSLAAECPEPIQKMLHSADVAVSIMEDILGSLLQVGQLDAGRITPHITHFQLAQLFSRLKIGLAPQAEAKGLRFRVLETHATIQSDKALLERILSNLITNAIRFTEVGGILLGVRRRGDQLSIEVWDTGCGIPDDQLAPIFEEFHQVSQRANETNKGLGLGLNIAQRLAELLDHQISVRSRLGHGSVFSIFVPAGNVWQSELGEPEISERIGGEFVGTSILVVEDDELLRNTTCAMLERWGVEVASAPDGDHAIALIKDGTIQPDLLLLDYRLPNRETGLDVWRRIEAELGENVLGIVVTADTEPDVIEHIRSSGMPVLIKPIIPARLRSAMHHLLYEQSNEPREK